MFAKPINLPQIVSDALTLSPNATRDELEAALINGVETSVGRLLDEHERNQIAVELYGQWNAREEAKCPHCGTTMETALDLMIALKNSLHGTTENPNVLHCKGCDRQQPARNGAMAGMAVVS